VASRSPESLVTLRERAPDAILLLSVPNDDVLDALKTNEALKQTIDGVTVRESVIDATAMSWLSEGDLLVFAWTVNDLDRVNTLIQLGVDGITTENLAILTLLGEQPSNEPELDTPP
jgi:glycerophosphoryl diester phosphodiesterase